jgi:hypothetical protein
MIFFYLLPCIDEESSIRILSVTVRFNIEDSISHLVIQDTNERINTHTIYERQV